MLKTFCFFNRNECSIALILRKKITMKHKNPKPHNLFEEADRLAKLSQLKDPLEKLNQRIDSEQFRSLLDKALLKPGEIPEEWKKKSS